MTTACRSSHEAASERRGFRLTSSAEAARSFCDELVRHSRAPGIQYLAVGPNQVLFEYAGGWADVVAHRELTGATTMMRYSMSKTITAAAVLQLVEEQRLTLDDRIDTHLDFQPYGPDITVRHLLSHTSGIPNPIPLRWVHPAAYHDTFDERVELIRVLRKYARPSFAPGTKYQYSNIGYWLLGPIVEHASGERFSSYVCAHVVRPLGITPQELGYAILDSRNHAKGYLEKYSLMNVVKRVLIARPLIGEYEGRWLRLNDHYVNGAAFGGLVGTARAIGSFLQDQLRPHSAILADTTRRLFYTPQTLEDGTEIAMTLGWHTGAINGVGYFYKEGGGGGFHSMMRMYPSAGIGTVVIVNATQFDVRRCLDAIDRRFLERERES